jgi:hypothetical protein
LEQKIFSLKVVEKSETFTHAQYKLPVGLPKNYTKVTLGPSILVSVGLFASPAISLYTYNKTPRLAFRNSKSSSSNTAIALSIYAYIF